MNFKVISDIKDVEKEKLFYVYQADIVDNAKRFNETKKQIEDEYWTFHKEFLTEKLGFLAVLEDNNTYVAAIRVLPKENNNFSCEAFEVALEYRHKGLGQKLYREVIDYISKQTQNFTLEAHTWKTNEASKKAHQAVGFKIEKEYTTREDGTKDDFEVTMILER